MKIVYAIKTVMRKISNTNICGLRMNIFFVDD